MKPKSFELTALFRKLERHVSDDPKKPSGWWITVFLGSDSSLRLFFPDDLFAVQRTVGYTEDRHPIEKTILQVPFLAPGEPITLHVLIPLVDP